MSALPSTITANYKSVQKSSRGANADGGYEARSTDQIFVLSANEVFGTALDKVDSTYSYKYEIFNNTTPTNVFGQIDVWLRDAASGNHQYSMNSNTLNYMQANNYGYAYFFCLCI